ncbi:GNAT family N-acetyltransferase [Reinekea marina]|uniref:GNAT family N-acetyltransferase n=1 Tax=Reinekea marina TaxID=1310421 RepID=A0ABV7WRK0_9GAMM|nr:GNAT family N-acetyltransferase [Reinekea marina]MDN3648213.1 GNAT family N-acetyltransferase [Reinekea marina]
MSTVLTTPRLQLESFDRVDEATIIQYYLNEAEHLRNSGGPARTSPAQISDMLASWKHNTLQGTELRLMLIQQHKVIGTIGVSNIVRGAFQAAYIGYNLAENLQRQGFMTEALKATIDYAFNHLHLHRLMANYQPHNLASARVLEKLGFEKEGIAKNYLMVDGVWCDHVLTSLTNNHWTPLK